MKIFIGLFGSMLLMANVWAQMPCRLKKMVVSKLENKKMPQEDSTAQSYTIFYQGNKVAQIEHSYTDKAGKPQKDSWNFVRRMDSLWVLKGKDTVYRMTFDAQGRVRKARPAYGFIEYVYSYDGQGRLDSIRGKYYGGTEYDKMYKKFNYEKPQEATFRFVDGLDMSYKGVTVFDDKKNPFYPNLELCIALSSPFIYHFTPHNALKTYLLTKIGSVIAYVSQYEYNAQGYPILCKKYSHSSSRYEDYFQCIISYEYECK